MDGDLPINVVKELMGHSSISTTQKYYRVVDNSHIAKAAALQNKILDFELDKTETDLKMVFSTDFACNNSKKEKKWSA